jgi:5-methylcytosine-specific restriction protein A
MGLADLTDPAAVRQALAEHDELGEDAFLRKYGFGRAREYVLVHEGKRYASKAIVGAAYGHQHRDRGPLRARDFSGGEATVRQKLANLGFAEFIRASPADDTAAQPRNPDWSRDELILALDLYMRHRPSLPNKAGKEVAELSRLLSQLAGAQAATSSTFRNINGTYLKLTNFRSLDPNYRADGRVGMSHGGKGDQEVWADFAHDPARLRATADGIRAAIAAGEFSTGSAEAEVDLDVIEAAEGRVMTRLHLVRERSPKLARARKAQALRRHGRLSCEACGFDFQAHYGERGAGYIECHHTRPVHLLRPGDKTRLEDLALVCANCHRMIHARRPWLSIEELQSLCRISGTA